MSDSELLAALALPSLVEQESGGRVGVLGPQTKYGRAQGMTQMLPATAEATARKIGMEWRPEMMTGTDQEAADYQQALGEAYLREGIEATGNLEDGFRYYHGGPDRKQWGPKTNAYAEQVMGRVGGEPAPSAPSAVSQMSDEDLLAALGEGAEPAPAPAAPPPRAAAPKPRSTLPALPARLPQKAPQPTLEQDIGSGFLQPFKDLGHTVMEGYRSTEGGKPLDPFFIPKLAGAALNLGSAPLMAGARPTARAVNNTAGKGGLAPHAFTWNPKAPFRRLEGEEAQRQTEGQIMTALSAAKPATPKPVTVPKPKAMSVDELRAAKTAAYDATKTLGVAYDPKATTKLAGDITADLRKWRLNPNITPKAHGAAQEVADALSSGTPLDLTDVDQLRQMVDMATRRQGDAEEFMGRRIVDAIDKFVDSAGPAQVINGNAPGAAQAIRQARDLNARYRKVQTVTNEVDSAKLRASSTYAGGNEANAIRQELRPLLDKTSGKQIKNLTPAEAKAVRKVVEGTGAANAWRVTGKVLDPRGLLGQIMTATVGIPTKGLGALATMPLGMVASSRSNSATMRAVDDLLKVLSAGPAPKAPPPIQPSLYLAGRPAPPILSPAGLTGASVVAAPLARTRSRAPEKRTGSSGRK